MHTIPLMVSVASALLLCFPGPPSVKGEAWLIETSSAGARSPLVLSRFREGVWTAEEFPPARGFSQVFFPALGIDPLGRVGAVWAGRVDGEPPGVYCSFLTEGGWSAPAPVDSDSRRWDNEPVIAFDAAGRAVVAWSGLEGESTEIFVTVRENGCFPPPVRVSAPDGSPDDQPVLGRGDDGEVFLLWRGWRNGRSQIYGSRRGPGGWSTEEPISPLPDTDQTLPGTRLLSSGESLVTWRQDGKTVGLWPGKYIPRTLEGPSEGRPPLPKLSPDSESWILYFDQAGMPVSTRCHQALPPPEDRRTSPRTAGTTYYIGYGDSITYGHSSGSDTSGWYGSLLAGYLSARTGAGQFYLYNEGYPGARTSHLLNGDGPWDCRGINYVLDSHPAAAKILIMGGTNDISAGIASATIRYNLGMMVDRARARGVEPVLGTIIPRVDHDAYFTQSTELCINYIPPLAAAKDCRLADPFAVFMAYYPTDYFWQNLYGYPSSSWDGVHPCWPDGDTKIAQAWFQGCVPTPSASPTPSSTPYRPHIDSGDYDGDHTSDIAVFRPSTGLWSVKDLTRIYWGRAGDIPAPGDYRGDGTTGFAVFRPSTGLWAVQGVTRVYWGKAGDIPVCGDYRGDGTTGVAIYRPSIGLWAVKGVTRVFFGRTGDIPVPSHPAAGSRKLITVFRPESGLWAVKGVTRVYWGKDGDIPVPGDYRGDGINRFAIYRPSSGLWSVKGVTRAYFGKKSDLPSTGNCGNSNLASFAVFRSSGPLWVVRGMTRVYYGKPGDTPISGGVNN